MNAEIQQAVFVVDDDEAVRRALRWLLESSDFRVATFESAEAFLSACDTAPSGCLVLDLKMPGMGGLGLLRVLRERGWELPVIILTAHGTPAAVAIARDAGVVAFLEKPFDNESLLDRLEEVLAVDAAPPSVPRQAGAD